MEQHPVNPAMSWSEMPLDDGALAVAYYKVEDGRVGAHSAHVRRYLLPIEYMSKENCQSAFDWDPLSASKRDPFDRRALLVALGSSELVGVAETARARVV
ncbi:hypothetical protein ACVIJW_002258 [Bradyrhizobium barranii subsp. barranii]